MELDLCGESRSAKEGCCCTLRRPHKLFHCCGCNIRSSCAWIACKAERPFSGIRGGWRGRWCNETSAMEGCSAIDEKGVGGTKPDIGVLWPMATCSHDGDSFLFCPAAPDTGIYLPHSPHRKWHFSLCRFLKAVEIITWSNNIIDPKQL